MHPVGQLLPNRLGMFDMLGNALEHCQCSHDAAMLRFELVDREDPFDLRDGIVWQNGSRQSRGGGHLYPALYATAAYRSLYSSPAAPGFNSHQGFRVARTIAKANAGTE